VHRQYGVDVDKMFTDGANRDFAKKYGRAIRRVRLSMMLFSGIIFPDFKGISKCAPIGVQYA